MTTQPVLPGDEPGFEYVSTASIAEIAAKLSAAGSVLILTHAKPDGDALGTSLALHRGLRQLGLSSSILLAGPIDPNLGSMKTEADVVCRVEDEGLPQEDPDVVVVVDTGAWNQLEPFGEWLQERRDQTVGIDHHARGGDVAAMRHIDVTCASATQALVPILDAMNVDISQDHISEALFVGLATDTGWFRFSNAGPKVYELAARLMEAGADKDSIFARIEQNSSKARMEMQGRALMSLSLIADDSIALMRLSPEDFSASGARPESLAGIVNMPMEIGSVRAYILLVEFEPGLTKISFRSKPATGTSPLVDVNEMAARFGGGGHVHAAGARISGSIVEAEQQLLAKID